jgi:hypothetical protein
VSSFRGEHYTILGYKLIDKDYVPEKPQRVFWLSSQFGARESDATLIVKPGVAVRFDLGFIGRGNPEISKDKVSRFERQLEVDDKKYYSTTVIIVDRVGDRSTIVEQANKIDALIVQMSSSQWPFVLAQELSKRFDLRHPITGMKPPEVDRFIRGAVSKLDIQQFVSAISPIMADEEDDPD